MNEVPFTKDKIILKVRGFELATLQLTFLCLNNLCLECPFDDCTLLKNLIQFIRENCKSRTISFWHCYVGEACIAVSIRVYCLNVMLPMQ